MRQRFLGLLALGNILNGTVHFQWLTPGIEIQPAQSMYPAFSLVTLPDDAIFLVERFALTNHLVVKVINHHGPVVRMHQGNPAIHRALVSCIDPKQPIEHVRTLPIPGRDIQNVTPQAGADL